MVSIETLTHLSAILTLGLFTSMIAYFVRLSEDVDEKVARSIFVSTRNQVSIMLAFMIEET